MAQAKQTYSIIIDHKHYEWTKSTITGREIKVLAGVPAEYGVWRDLAGPNDPPVGDDEPINLTTHGTEKFFTGRKTTTEGQ